MIWLETKVEGAPEPPYRYTCSHCGTLLLSAEKRTLDNLPGKCPACGEGSWGERQGEGE